MISLVKMCFGDKLKFEQFKCISTHAQTGRKRQGVQQRALVVFEDFGCGTLVLECFLNGGR